MPLSKQISPSSSILSRISCPLTSSTRKRIPLSLPFSKVPPWITRSTLVSTTIPGHGWSMATHLAIRKTRWIVMLQASLTGIWPQQRHPCPNYFNHGPLSSPRRLDPSPPLRRLPNPKPLRLRALHLHFQKDHDPSPPLHCLPNPKLLRHRALHFQKDHRAQKPGLPVNLQLFHSSQILTQFNSVKAIFAASKTPGSFRRSG
jgi:hypothetical protein